MTRFPRPRTTAELESGLPHLRAAPAQDGTVALLVRRPAEGRRELLEEARLDLEEGVVGDRWLSQVTDRARAAGRHLQSQVNVTSARMAALLAADPRGQAQAGDQLFLDLDLSVDNLPAGTRLHVGSEVVLEVTAKPHTGCRKYLRWYGAEAVEFVNSPVGRRLRLRGLNARIVVPGVVRVGDPVLKVVEPTLFELV